MSLHRQLKEQFGPELGGRAEVVLQGFRVDAVAPDGALIEVQSGALGPLQGKLQRLLPEHRIRVIKPVVVARRVVRRAQHDGADLSARLSPKRGAVVEVFDDLIGLARVFPHPNLRIDVLAVEIDEVRVTRRRWPGYGVVDRRLREVVAAYPLRTSDDLWELIPGAGREPFTTLDLAERLGRPIALARRVAYCLRLTRAVQTLGKRGRFPVYARTGITLRTREREAE